MSTPIMTVCYPWRRTPHDDGSAVDEIMIGIHKDTPGARRLKMVDKDNGPGGKMKPGDETVRHCAQRELEEEIGIKPHIKDITLAGIVHVNNAGFEADIYFYFADGWIGDIVKESREFRNIRWCNINALPYENMMDADRKYWLPLHLFGAMMRRRVLRTSIVHNEEMVVTFCSEFEYVERNLIADT